MKTLIAPIPSTFFFSLFLLSIFTSNLPSAAADVVTDRDGDALMNGGTYHILPLFGVRDGGVELAATGNETCPLTVVQSRTSKIFRGLPVIISSPYRIAYINEALILNLAFASPPSCAPTPPKWTVVKDLPEGLAVKLPGYSSTVSGWFKIEKSSLEYLYKVVFCARSGGTCGEVGISVDDEGMSRLVLTEEEDDGIIVEFMKASSVGV
ncbi:trypsin inhibitor A-like [Vigna radiata var. radiata]|uniref:Trypsin inhibitor A-like n=1 Tax=Vigna radiata var. radiata TaxID=3916 RepID=A0A1S3TFY8_VIGRR|nr:trypsin inhibitor A-like [Vigna radiata var. radiata]